MLVQAEEAVCPHRTCAPVLVKRKRTLFGATLTYATSGEHSRIVTVECTRALWIFGHYDCNVVESDTHADERFRP